MAYEVYAQGQGHLAQVYFQAVAFTGPFYVGLGTGGIPTGRAKTLADVTEVAGLGYGRKSITREIGGTGWTLVDNMVSSPVLTFTSTNPDPNAEWDPIEYAFLTLSPSGVDSPNVLISCIEVPETLILGGGDSESIVFKFSLTD